MKIRACPIIITVIVLCVLVFSLLSCTPVKQGDPPAETQDSSPAATSADFSVAATTESILSSVQESTAVTNSEPNEPDSISSPAGSEPIDL